MTEYRISTIIALCLALTALIAVIVLLWRLDKFGPQPAVIPYTVQTNAATEAGPRIKQPWEVDADEVESNTFWNIPPDDMALVRIPLADPYQLRWVDPDTGFYKTREGFLMLMHKGQALTNVMDIVKALKPKPETNVVFVIPDPPPARKIERAIDSRQSVTHEK
jgi:hypothetical protein